MTMWRVQIDVQCQVLHFNNAYVEVAFVGEFTLTESF